MQWILGTLITCKISLFWNENMILVRLTSLIFKILLKYEIWKLWNNWSIINTLSISGNMCMDSFAKKKKLKAWIYKFNNYFSLPHLHIYNLTSGREKNNRFLGLNGLNDLKPSEWSCLVDRRSEYRLRVSTISEVSCVLRMEGRSEGHHLSVLKSVRGS